MSKAKSNNTIQDFLTGKSDHTKLLFTHFINEYRKIGLVTLHPAKTMIGIANDKKRIAWITNSEKILFMLSFLFQKPILIIYVFKK